MPRIEWLPLGGTSATDSARRAVERAVRVAVFRRPEQRSLRRGALATKACRFGYPATGLGKGD